MSALDHRLPQHMKRIAKGRHRRRNLVVGIVVAFALIGLTLHTNPATSPRSLAAVPLAAIVGSPPVVHVKGNQLVDGAGDPVVLHGVDLSGSEFSCIQGGSPTDLGWSIYGGQPLNSPSTYAAMASWDIDVVRVPLNEDCWLGINNVNPAYGGASYRAAIESEVAAINAAGMAVILDLHWTSPGSYAAEGQQPMADADHSVAFWQSVAGAFKSDSGVIFDLFNEPFLYSNYFTNANQNPWQCWLEGCSLNQFVSANQTLPDGTVTGYTTGYTWQTAGMQGLIDAVRSTGADQPILVNGLDWANDDSGWLANAPTDPDNQLIVGAHIYPGTSCDTTSCWSSVFSPLETKYPVLIGETGDNSNTAVSPFLPSLLSYGNAHGWSYVAWTWNPWSNPSDVLITDWSGDPTSGEGVTYKADLRALASSSSASNTTSDPPASTTTSDPPASTTTSDPPASTTTSDPPTSSTTTTTVPHKSTRPKKPTPTSTTTTTTTTTTVPSGSSTYTQQPGYPIYNENGTGHTNSTVMPQSVHIVAPGDLILVYGHEAWNAGQKGVGVTDTAGIINWHTTPITALDPGSAGQTMELWYGVATGTGTTTIDYHWAANTRDGFVYVDELHNSVGGAWTINNAGYINGINGTSSTVTYPNLTSPPTGGIYFGVNYSGEDSTCGGTTPSAFTCQLTPNDNAVLSDLNLGDNTAYSPTNQQSPASYWTSIAVTLSAHG